jgi:hypothetical protein
VIVEIHNKLGEPLRVPATRLVVYDDMGNPVAFVLQMGPHHVRVCDAMDPDFEMQLEAHGLRRAVLVTRRELRDLRAPRLTS